MIPEYQRQNYKKNKIIVIVTGALGFIGFNLVKN